MQTSKLVFVDMPGAERLAMDPEVLLLREGVLLNKSLLDFSRGEPWCGQQLGSSWARTLNHTGACRVRASRHASVCPCHVVPTWIE